MRSLPLVDLDLNIGNEFLHGCGRDSCWLYSSFPSLKTLRLQFYKLHGHAQDTAAWILHTFLKSSPAIHTLTLSILEVRGFGVNTLGPVQNLLELAITGKNELPQGVLVLRKIDIAGAGYTMTPALASAVNGQTLRELFFSATDAGSLTLENEGFWLALTKRVPSPVTLTALRCPRLTPALIDFLRSFSGLERLEFDAKFYPAIPSHSRPNAISMQAVRDAEIQVLDMFFDEVLPVHRNSLRHLALCGYIVDGEVWEMLAEYLDRICECSALRELHIPIRYPGPDLVCFPLSSPIPYDSTYTWYLNVLVQDYESFTPDALSSNFASRSLPLVRHRRDTLPP